MHNGGTALTQSRVDNRNQDYMKKHIRATVQMNYSIKRE